MFVGNTDRGTFYSNWFVSWGEKCSSRHLLAFFMSVLEYTFCKSELCIVPCKKQCIAKIFITQKVCSGWAWEFINTLSLIQTYNYKTFTRFHVRLVCHLFFLWKLLFMSSASEEQHATKLMYAKRKFMQLMMRKPFYFSKLVRINDVTHS